MDEKKSSSLDASVPDFKDTLCLPRTDFPLRADSAINDPLMLERWEKENLFEKAQSCNAGSKKFILHDGPPYANGHIHLGHAYNKILKDMVTKARRMMGFHTPAVPGWDCHGLPIEHKVTQEQPEAKGAELKAACRAYAAQWIDTQKAEFKRLGVLMDWNHPYITMAPRYEASVLQVFAKLVEGGFIERKNKSIPWCASCKTALATAEIEYQDRTDPSLYILFDLTKRDAERLLPTVLPVSIVAWTTTPWTIPLNRALLLRPGYAYRILKLPSRYLIVGADLAENLIRLLQDTVSEPITIAKTIPAEVFEGMYAQHPLTSERLVPLIFDQSVSVDEGTACVHCAPGCGPSDYEAGIKNNLEIYSPLTADGRYTTGIEPAELNGKTIIEGQKWVTERLAGLGKLLFKTQITHSYPHCWRCHNPLMFRATPQWFCDLEHDHIKENALQAIEKLEFLPAQGKNFLRATVENRWEWCLSRQRSWGTPIVALVKKDGSHYYLSEQLITAVAEKVAQEGIEYWDRVTLEELAAMGAVPADLPLAEYRKETDILDVWFDAGVSHFAVLRKNPELQFPADLYLEGVDQHRGWFQSSLLTSIILSGQAPTKAFMTHGFTVDEKGRKMSKSIGNVIAPQQIIDTVGTDGLRLWVASIGHEGDAVVSEKLINHVGQVYRKIRNTCRFLLQNLYDYDHAQDAVAFDKLAPLDVYILHQLSQLQEQALKAYECGNVTALFHLLNDFCTVEISAFYGDIVKDCLYCDSAKGAKRRAVQTAFWHILDTLTRLMAPILSFAAEQVSDFYQKNKPCSIHLQRFADHAKMREFLATQMVQSYESQWEHIKDIRSAVLRLIEEQRAAGVVKHSLEASVVLFIDTLDTLTVIGEQKSEFFQQLCIVSEVVFAPVCDGLVITAVEGVCAQVQRAPGTKCPRCWQWAVEVGTHGLCPRCSKTVK